MNREKSMAPWALAALVGGLLTLLAGASFWAVSALRGPQPATSQPAAVPRPRWRASPLAAPRHCDDVVCDARPAGALSPRLVGPHGPYL